jgi:hypothetical protein
MQRLADRAGNKLMVNYWNAWVAPTHEIFHRVRADEVVPVQKMDVYRRWSEWLVDHLK